jgi:hypothetical protein
LYKRREIDKLKKQFASEAYLKRISNVPSKTGCYYNNTVANGGADNNNNDTSNNNNVT